MAVLSHCGSNPLFALFGCDALFGCVFYVWFLRRLTVSRCLVAFFFYSVVLAPFGCIAPFGCVALFGGVLHYVFYAFSGCVALFGCALSLCEFRVVWRVALWAAIFIE